MKKKINCFFGRHDWHFRTYYSRRGYAIGNQCKHCGLWATDSARGPWPEEEPPEINWQALG